MSESHALRHRLAAELRRLRTQARLTQRHVADELDWSPSKLIRIEEGTGRTGVADVRALTVLYRVTDPQIVADLVALARRSGVCARYLDAEARLRARTEALPDVGTLLAGTLYVIVGTTVDPDGRAYQRVIQLAWLAALLLLLGCALGVVWRMQWPEIPELPLPVIMF